MASKLNEFKAEQERLDRQCRKKIDIICELKCRLKHAEDRVLCSNWIDFLSSCAKDEARVRECLLDQMERQLRKGPLTRPFTTHVYNRSDLVLLLDEEGRERLHRSSQLEMATSMQFENSLGWGTCPFVWRERVKHLSALEEKYLREEQELRWLKEQAANQEVGVQVGLPGISLEKEAVKKQEVKKQESKKQESKKQESKKQEVKKQDIKKQDIKKQEVKKQEVKKQEVKKQESKKQESKKPEAKKPEAKKQEAKKQEVKKQDIKKQEIKKQEIKKQEDKKQEIKKQETQAAEQRRLDRQRWAEAQQERELHLLNKQRKVKVQRDYELNLIKKRREAQSPLRDHKTTQRHKPAEVKAKVKENVKPVREVKKVEPVHEARKEVKCAMCHSITTCLRCQQQAVLRAENIKEKVMAYEELKQYHGRRASEERERLKMKQEIAGQKQEAKQGRAPGGRDPSAGRTKQEEVIISKVRDQNRKQGERERGQGREEDLLGKSGRQLEKERKRLQEEFEEEEKAREKEEKAREKEEKARKKAELRRQRDLLTKYEMELEDERNEMIRELEKIQEAREEYERKREERKQNKQLEKERKRMQEEYEKEQEAREESERRRERNRQIENEKKKIQEQFEKENIAKEESERRRERGGQRESERKRMQEEFEKEERAREESKRRRERERKIEKERNRMQEELEGENEAEEESQRRRERERERESERKRMQEEFEKEERAREESERRRERERKFDKEKRRMQELEKENEAKRESERRRENERKIMQEEFEKEERAREESGRRRERERNIERENKRMQEELEKENEAKIESERKRENERQIMQEEFKKENKAREESGRRERQLMERNRMEEEFEKENKAIEHSQDMRRQLENERDSLDRNIDDSRYDFFNLRKKELMQEWADLRKKYKKPAEELNPAQENARRKKEIKAKKKFLTEITNHTEQLNREIYEKSKSRKKLLNVELEQREERARNDQIERRDMEEQPPQENGNYKPLESEMTLQQATEKFMGKARQICDDMEASSSSSNPYEEVQRDLENVKNENQQLTRQFNFSFLDIHRQERLARDKVISQLFAECNKKAEKNCKQADVMRQKFLAEIMDVDEVMKRICATLDDDTTQAPEQQRLQAGSRHQQPSGSDTESTGREAGSYEMLYKRETWTHQTSSSGHGDEADTESIGRESCSIKVLYKREPWSASSEEEPRRYPADIIVSYCTQTGKKHYPHISRTAGIRRQQEPLHCRNFRQLLRGSRPTELSPRIVTARNCILGRKLYVAKRSALSKHIKKSLTQEAGRLIECLVYKKAKDQPKDTFKVLVGPLLKDVEDIRPGLLENIHRTDVDLEEYLKNMFDAHVARNRRQQSFIEPSTDLYHREHLVSDLLEDFCDLDPQVNENIPIIDRRYKVWRDQQLDLT